MQTKANQFYRIEIKEQLDERWQGWFEDLTLMRSEDDNTVLSGIVVDQAALYGILKKINNLGLTLISINPHGKENVMEQEVPTQNDSMVIKATFGQKSAGVSLFIIASATVYYLAQVWPMRPIALAGTAIPDGYGSLVLTTLGLIVVTQIVLQIVLVFGSGSAPKPSDQELVATWKAKRNAYSVFTVGVLAIISLLFVGFPAFCMANLAMLSLLLAEITRFASQIFYARQAL